MCETTQRLTTKDKKQSYCETKITIDCILVVSPRASIRYHCLAYFQLIIGYGYQCVPFIAITLAIEIVCSIWCRPVFLIRLKISNPHECTGRIAFVCAFYCVILFDAIDCAHEISVTEAWALEIYLFTSTTRIWAHDICFDFLDPIPCIAFVHRFHPITIFPAFIIISSIFWIIITICYLCQVPCRINLSIMVLRLMPMIWVVRYCAKIEIGFFNHYSNEGDFTRDARCNLHNDCQICYVWLVQQLLLRLDVMRE